MSKGTCVIVGCGRRRHARGYCPTHYTRWWSAGTTEPPLKPSVEERFWSKVDIAAPADCWRWLAYIAPTGYGNFRIDGRPHPAHRVAYRLHVGEIPDGLVIDHLCRNRTCVNPDHLEPVTNRENVVRGVAAEVNRDRMLARTHCKNGHEFSPENTSTDNRGRRRCKACHRANQAAYLMRQAS